MTARMVILLAGVAVGLIVVSVCVLMFVVMNHAPDMRTAYKRPKKVR